MDTMFVALALGLSAVTVHPESATLLYTGTLSLKRGYNQYVWADMPPLATDLRPILPPTAGASILESRIEPYSPILIEEPADLRLMRRRIDSLEKLLYQYESRLALLKTQEATLLENKKLGGEEGNTSAPAVEAYLRLLGRELPALRESMYPLTRSIEAVQDSLTRWKKAYECRKQHYTQGRSALYLRLWSPQNEVLPLRVEVQLPMAHWETRYLIRLPAATEGRLYVQRWAAIQNKTGIDWKNVQLTLSTALPIQSASAPSFQSWYVELMEGLPVPLSMRAVTAKAVENSAEAFAESEAEEEKPERLRGPQPAENQTLLVRTYTLGPQTIFSGPGTLQLFLKEDTFAIQPFFMVNAPFAQKAYLRAALPIQDLQLFEAGQAQVEVEGQPVGQFSWPPAPDQDTLWLDLGPTERIVVTREEVLRRREGSTTGSSIRHVFAYRVSVISTYAQPVRLMVWDRIPVSRHSEVKVELTENGKGTLEPETGRLVWNLTLQPQGRWETTFRFAVRAPCGKLIVGL